MNAVRHSQNAFGFIVEDGMTIKELYEQVCYKKNLATKLEDLKKQKSNLESKMQLLKTQYEKEQRDVDKLESSTFSAFFHSIAGNLEEKLNKETREMLAAKSIYDNAAFQLNNINADIAKYEKQISELTGCEERYEEAVKIKLNELKGCNPEIVKLQTELAASQNKIREIREAIQAGDITYAKAQAVSKELGKADNWAMFDVFGGGIVADIVKYGHIDKSQELVNDMYSSMASFKTELSDISVSAKVDISVDGLLMTADYIFDNIFTDFAVKNRIENALRQINDVIFKINDVLYNLKEMEKSESEKSEQLKQKLERCIIEM